MASRVENPQEPQKNGDCRFPCNLCGRTFKRLEHLGRHRQSHQDVKKFVCPVCFKRFARSDILLRHRLIHLAAPTPSPLESTGHQAASHLSGRGPRRKRACQACARAHEGCSMGDPCRRCLIRSMQCVYAASKSDSRKKGKPIETRPRVVPEPETPAAKDAAAEASFAETRNASRQRSHPGHSLVSPTRLLFTTQAPAPFAHGAPADESLVPNRGMGLLFSEMAPGAEKPTADPGDQPPFEDNAAQAVSLLLDMQPACDGTQLMPSHDFGVSGGANFLTPRPTDTIPDPTTTSRADGHPVYNTWNPQGLPTDGPTLNFPINWLPENLHIDLDYVSILGQSLSLVLSDLDSPAAPFQQMHPPVPAVEPGPLPPDLELSSTMPLVMHNGGDGLGNAYVTSSEHTPSAPRGLRNALPSSRRERGHLYTTSINGARVPCTVRDKRDYVPIPGTKHLSPIDSEGISLGAGPSAPLSRLPALNHISVAHRLAAAGANMRIWPSTYEHIRQGIRQAYLASGEARLFDDHAIPSLEQLNFFVHLYFQKCNPVLPILHEHVIPLNDSWLLALAVSTVGSQYTLTEEFTGLSGALHEILHRALLIELEADNNTGNLALVQALFLSQIGLLYHGPPRLFRRAKANHGVLVDLLRCGMLLEPPAGQQQTRESGVSSSAVSIEQEWSQWIHDEARRRLGYAIWLLDCMMVFQMGHRALMSLSDAQARLPHDGLWAASTAEKWHSIMTQSQANPNLPSATQQLFVEKHVKPDLGEFSRIILLHGVYQEIWQVKRYFDRPLSNWVLSAQAVAPDDLPARPAASSPMGAASDRQAPVDGPTYSSWRNAACDCVDVLHWAANGMIAQLSGSEHTTVFHLHFARVVLLTPFDEIQTLARYLASLGDYHSDLGPLPTRSQGLAAERAIIEWAQQDEHKARLAVLHCGCFFWHIRRYSAMAFYEPVAVFMATLSIWAYSSYASRATNANRRLENHGQEIESRSGTVSQHASPRLEHETLADDPLPAADNHWHHSRLPDAMDERFPSFVHLDRPNDDEMVQLFVRSGRPSVMQAYISGIGDICSPKAPVRILKEGVKILTNVSMVWGRTDRYINVLTAMNAALLKFPKSGNDVEF